VNLSRQTLRNRHRLSHQQIDGLLGEKKSGNFTAEKLKQMQGLRFFFEFTSDLRSLGIWFMVLKGPILSGRIYGDPTYRLMNDFDILVEPKSVDLLNEMLVQMGFESRYFEWPDSPKRKRVAMHITNQLGFFNPETGILIEVHWRLFSNRVANHTKTWEIIKKNTESAEFAGKPFIRFNMEFELLYLAIHGSIHAWFRLKWLVDVHELLKRCPFDEEHFKTLVQEFKAERFVDVCNVMLKEYFPDGKMLPDQKSDVKKLADFSKQQITRESDYVGDTIRHTIASIRYRMALTNYIPYKLDLLKLFAICQTDLNYKWIPPYKTAFYLFRPFGYLYRATFKS